MHPRFLLPTTNCRPTTDALADAMTELTFADTWPSRTVGAVVLQRYDKPVLLPSRSHCRATIVVDFKKRWRWVLPPFAGCGAEKLIKAVDVQVPLASCRGRRRRLPHGAAVGVAGEGALRETGGSWCVVNHYLVMEDVKTVSGNWLMYVHWSFAIAQWIKRSQIAQTVGGN